ncbi:MAG TPA: LD-carboxypeptidase [Pseudonocardia sp.]|nr:LD-carboxypeptidase [Pseudonocardia sp.]
MRPAPERRTWPPALRAGDRVAVVLPAGPPSPGLLATGLDVLRSWGLRVDPVEAGRHPRLPYLAADDAVRAARLQEAWCDPDVAAVLCGRGGYGTLRVLDLVDWDAMAAVPPKPFVGSSDVTALHAVLGPRCGVVTLFGAMVATAAITDPAAQDHLRRALFDPRAALPAALGARTLVGGRATGPTVGGTLSLVVSTLGVDAVPPPPDGAIALLEDVGEAPYRLDRLLTHLLRARWFDRIAGIALGSWKACGPPEEVHEVLLDRLAPLGVPTAAGFGFGHCPGQLTVPLGAEVVLDAEAASLTLAR